MRILHITTFLQGGAGRIIASLAVAQKRGGHEVMVAGDAGGEPGYESYPEYLDQIAAAGIPFHPLTSTFKRDLNLNVQAAAQLRSIIDSKAPDVAHAHAAIPSMIARLAMPADRGVALVATMHGWGVRKTREQAETDITLLGMTDAVVTPSAAARDTLMNLGISGAPVQVIPYGIERELPSQPVDTPDRELIDQLRRARRRVAMCIGTIGERKNQRLLVSALGQAAAADVDAILIGDGDAAALKQFAQELGVASRLHVLGYRTNASRYLPLADVMVLPSRNEGLPIAVLESLRASVPVVASAIPEIAEAIEDGRSGFLFESENAAALASSLARALHKSGDRSFRASLRGEFEARYVEEKMTAAYDRLYDRIRQAATSAKPVR